MSLPNQTQVLIVGGGPVGMTCALVLANLGMEVTIVDASPIKRSGSRASVIHPHSLEVLNKIGLAEPLMMAGIQSNGHIIHGGSNKLLVIDVTLLGGVTEFPVTLLIPQHEVETILEEKLAAKGVKVFRNHTVVGIKEAPLTDGQEATFDDGSTISARYVVGADGSRSTIRSLAGIKFADPGTGIIFDEDAPSKAGALLADVYFEEPLPDSIVRNAISLHLDGGFFLCPLKSRDDSKQKSFWRIGMGTHMGEPEAPHNPGVEYLQTQLDARAPWSSKVKIASVETASRYKIRSAVASTFFQKMGRGDILLVGDAAHIHSPAGSQGLNLGFCDAFALAGAIHAHADASLSGVPESEADLLLSEYSSSRRKIALEVVSMTRSFGSTMMGLRLKITWQRVLRNTLLWILGCFPFVRRAMAWKMSGLKYRDT